ncbi:elongation factor Ts [Achromatium sp. WMS3]|nr:elongation factor Ts [Achromatium sp. WMS3]
MTISAALVKELRDRTGTGMMECKKALVETKGDIDAAIELMRKLGQAKAAKKSSRIAAEGVICLKNNLDTSTIVMLEVNSETDFVAKDENFRNFAEDVANCLLNGNAETIEALLAKPLNPPEPNTVQQALEELITKLGENLKVRRFKKVQAQTGILFSYIHGTRIGVVVEVEGGDATLGRDLAMHIAASNPTYMTKEDVSQEAIAKEREIAMAQAKTEAENDPTISKKPPHVIQMIRDKKVEGRVGKFISEVTLMMQPFVKDPKITVGGLLKQHNAKVIQFQRLEVGEGIEKKKEDFAAEVAAQAGGL